MRFVVGDIHGMKSMLDGLLGHVFKNRVSELIFLGDYIGKGPESREVLDTLMKLSRETEVTCLLGNHEYVLLEYLNGALERRDFLMKYGGREFIENYFNTTDYDSVLLKMLGNENVMEKKHLAFLKGLRHYYSPQNSGYICVHGGLKENFDLENGKYDLEDIVFLRNEFIESRFYYKTKKIIFGHTADSQPYVDDYKIGIDTGAVYTLTGKEGYLSAFEIEKGFFLNDAGKVFTLDEVRRRSPHENK